MPPTESVRSQAVLQTSLWKPCSMLFMVPQLVYLDSLGTSILRRHGRKLRRAAIIRAMVAAVEKSGLDLSGAATEGELEDLLVGYLKGTQTAVPSSSARHERREAVDPVERLSAREREIFGMIAAGLRADDIAARLGTSVRTIETQQSRLMGKLGMSSRAELIHYAALRGMRLTLPADEKGSSERAKEHRRPTVERSKRKK